MHGRRQPPQPNVRPISAVRRLLHYPSPIRVQYLTGILNAPIVSIVSWSEGMGHPKYLMAEEVAQRYRGAAAG